MPPRLVGVLLFIPVPFVLFLFTRAPLGILPSLGVGVLLMLTHRLYARPWALARAQSRCLWCGAALPPGAGSALLAFAVEEPPGRTAWRACREDHARPLRSVLEWADRRRRLLAVGILGTLGVFLAWGLASGLGWLGRTTFDDAVAFFRLGIALTVLPLGWLAARTDPGESDGALRSPFPLHAPALVGLRAVLWLFRLVGLVWLAQGSLRVARAMAGRLLLGC